MTAIEHEQTGEETPWHLSGNNAPVTEELTVTELEVRGAIPPELRGRYFRNGANPQTGWSAHWFLGDGMIHGVRLADGRAHWYRNRYVRTPMFAKPGSTRMDGYVDPETFAFDFTVSAANTHVISHADRILALEEGAFPYEMTPELDTIGPTDFGGALATPFTAHPKTCPETREMFGFGYQAVPPYLTYHRFSPDGRLVQTEEITVGGATMMHDCALSREHMVFLDLPAVFDAEAAMSGSMPIRWSDDYPARFGVMPRDGGDADVQWFDVDPCYMFHTLNAHDEGGEVVVRGCRLPELWRDSADLGVDDVDPGLTPMMWEWRLDRATGTVKERQVDDRPSEFPRVPDAVVGLDSRYGYTMAFSPTGDGGEILKYDYADGGSRTTHAFPDGHSVGEPVFAPAEGASNQDDGWLMSFVYDAGSDTSHLVLLDASDMAAAPVAEVQLPCRVPTGFHGSWIPDVR